ncbi:MAG: FG-GAP repeat protein [Planctomycetota bacterium]
MSRRSFLAIALGLLGLAPPVMAQEELIDPSPLAGAAFGHEVAVDRGTALVGQLAISGAGRVQVFEEADGWQSSATLTPSISEIGDQFGRSVAISGTTAVVGAPGSGEVGRVFVFRKTWRGWREELRLEGTEFQNTGSFDRFGLDVAVSGDNLVALSTTRTLFFTRIAGSWKLNQVFTLVKGQYSSCALDGGRAAIGAKESPEGGHLAPYGTVWTYVFDGATWSFDQRLYGIKDPLDDFGARVALSGDRLAVGDYRPRSSDPAQGNVFVFWQTGGSWHMEVRLRAPIALDSFEFAASVDIDTGRLVVGEPHSLTPGSPAGAVHTYVSQGGWHLIRTDISPEPMPYDSFGRSVAVSGDDMIVGEPGEDDELTGQGAAWHLSVPPAIRIVTREFALVVDILVGVAEGGGGIIIVPGEGPVPVDPDPFLPVLTMVNQDERAQKVALDEIQNRLPSDMRGLWTSNVEDALRYPDTVLYLQPPSFAAATKWLYANRDRLIQQRRVPMVLLGLSGDKELAVLQKLMQKNAWY